MLNDNTQRQKAIDPRGSFIVQAPAGSGKTEILTQRYLRLLNTVSAPEQIIALTFTRKAANEMRERILLALQDVATGAKATSMHQQQTYRYAENALAQDNALNWQLLKQPGRLRIITIDSLCQTITQAIPLQEKQIPFAEISDKPQNYYLAAAHACLTYAIEHPDYHQSLTVLLQHLDNRQDNLLALFSSLLSKRDQWLVPLYQARMQDKAMYEQALAWIEQHELSRFCQSVPQEHAHQLISLTRQLANIDTHPNSPRYPLRDWESFNQLNGLLVASLAELLLTSQNTLRKAFDHHVGLRRDVCEEKDYIQLKTASKILLSKLDELPDFLTTLLRVKKLPAPRYDPEQWNVLQALFTLLPLLAGHLHLIFNEHNEVDFTAISQQALEALGNEESPTDLALYLDNHIQHILVDEFQDTSIQQFQLLNQLVQGWHPDDGKTLFVVGDPMQSIYRFRSAEVGLFLRAKLQGIGPVNLTPLALNCNFRSTETMVNWVNSQFKSIFPQTIDIESGAVPFHSSVSAQTRHSNSFVKAFQFENRAQEAQALVKCVIDELQSNPTDNMTILVRSRKQLSDIIQVLREQQIPYQGVEIDLLANLPHLRDVWSLTQALLMPANRLAWLALLRSPWCGLSLADLHTIANVAKNQSIYFALSRLKLITALSNEGRLRVNFLYTILHDALCHRHQQSLVDWIAHTLKALHLDQVLDSTQQDDLEQYWLLLERFEKDGQIADMTLFKNEFNKLYSQHVTPSRLQIMTIHKSKGLEFDCVILPGLSDKSRNIDTPLLRWFKLPTQEHGEILLLSPMKAAHHEHCLLYDYLGKLDAQKNSYELQRLLYVAVTRAKKRLYLFDNHLKGNQGTFRHLLENQEFIMDEKIEHGRKEHAFPTLMHLPIHFYQQPPALAINHPNVSSLTISNNNSSRPIGVVAHELLQWICNHHPPTIAEVPWELVNHQLKTIGFTTIELQSAHALIKKQFTQLFNDPIGQWIIKMHVDEHNEYELLIEDQGDIATRIIDRTFCENDIRWIIDFKTGREDIETQTHHRQQVNDYAHILSSQSSQPVHCGLYYLASGLWLNWAFVPTSS